MDVVLYAVAAAILALLVLFAVKTRGQAEQDREQRRDVEARVRPQVADERGAGMPRRRRNLNTRLIAQRRAQRDAADQEESDGGVEVEEEEEEELQFQNGKLGAKKQRKLEEKQAKRAQREAELEEREERKRTQELREEERRREEERERLEEQKKVEEEQQQREEQERREHEEYLRLRDTFTIEEQGLTESLTEHETQNLLQEFIQYIKASKVVLLEDLASHFKMRTQDAISRLQDLIADGSLTGVIDDRGKFIFISPEELSAVAQFIRQRGRVSIAELAKASNSLITLTPSMT
ncbi:DDRGK domain-containing protein 1 isoform X2 [Amia ocellicauda]|uniref:DDRGK domain-containing protein 1 isoform X2 n=1 Tax=Amia ocellicauda TaxID=2972642 RepID=UPI0034643175